MFRRLAPAALLALLPLAPAHAADRQYQLTSFDRIRIEAPVTVRLTVGISPRGSASGDARALDNLDVRIEGTTLIIRPAGGEWGEQRDPRGGVVPETVVTLGTLSLTRATLIGGGRLGIDGAVRAQRLDLSMTGSGTIALSGAANDQLGATVLGTGSIALAGRAQRARLIVSGSGAISADALDTNDLNVRLDGPGVVDARARFTAALVSTGLGRITIDGAAKCTVAPGAGGPIRCAGGVSGAR